MQHKHVASLEEQEFECSWNVQAKAMVDLGTSCGLHDIQDTINHIRTKSLDKEFAEMRNLRENTLLFLKEYLDYKQYYVETDTFHQADKMLNKKHLTVLTGHPGEGKTTMVAYLALKRSKPENIVQLSHASDWRKIDLTMKLFSTVIIDDIFGAGALDISLLSEWKRYLREIVQAATEKRLDVIITSRHYIKEQALDYLNDISIFKDEEGYIVHLASNDLTYNEKREILLLRAKRYASEDMLKGYHVDIDSCVLTSKSNSFKIDKTDNFAFGFPQCSNLFVQNEKMIKLGPLFFEKPEAYFKTCIEQLYNVKDDDIFHKFLALVIVWAEPTGRIKADSVRNPANASEHIRYVASIFDIEVNRKFIENIISSLKSHQKDLLLYVEHSGEYMFSHNVIGDMVGVVLGDARRKTVETIELCPRGFLMDRICLENATNKEYLVVVGIDNYHHLCKKFAKMICSSLARDYSTESTCVIDSALCELEMSEPVIDPDFEIFWHRILCNKHFVEIFMKYIIEGGHEQVPVTTRVIERCKLRLQLISEFPLGEIDYINRGELIINEMTLICTRRIEERVADVKRRSEERRNEERIADLIRRLKDWFEEITAESTSKIISSK
ncbi:hypothetical protein DPMN_134373 [Dreissena polymorpha]|uniref:Novel STAND NTPase 3 domain-containing protein n=1 Tax=Dreissena polymorpha TaxID=45954 RepID=A0A9D4JBU6_DREPO|nr:hypothetical protein DPMN_134373 [Dreissena polymorpha]